MLEESDPAHALFDSHRRRTADHDGATRPLRIAVLLFPPGRSGSRETHLLRLIEKHISFEFVREGLRASYSETGRPSIDPELLLRILLIGYLYGITSERKLVEEPAHASSVALVHRSGLRSRDPASLHVFEKPAWTGLQESKLFGQLFEQKVKQCVEVGLVQGKHLSVDGSFVEANAAKESRIPREQLAEAAPTQPLGASVSGGPGAAEPGGRASSPASILRYRPPIPRFYLRHQGRHTGSAGILRQLSGLQSELCDRRSAGHGGACMSQETVAAQAMLARFAQWQGREPESVAADTTYGNGEFLQWLADRNITPYIPEPATVSTERGVHSSVPERFTYEPEHDRYICPAGQPLNYGGESHRNHAWTYIGTRKRCSPCARSGPQCTRCGFPMPGHPSARA